MDSEVNIMSRKHVTSFCKWVLCKMFMSCRVIQDSAYLLALKIQKNTMQMPGCGYQQFFCSDSLHDFKCVNNLLVTQNEQFCTELTG